MPTLFHKEDILSGEEREETIYFSELYELPEGVEDPYITIKIDDETRSHQEAMWRRYLKPRILPKGRSAQIVMPDRTLEYVMQMLTKCMVKTEHLFDDPSFALMRKRFARSKTITTFLAERITRAFEEDGLTLKAQDEEDEKNSEWR